MPDILNSLWNALHAKYLVIIFLVAAFLTEIMGGYFKLFPAYLKSVNWRGAVLPWGAGIGVYFLLLFTVDTAAKQSVPEWSAPAFQWVIAYGAEMGRSIWIFLFLAYLFLSFNRKARETVFGATLATCLTGLSATVFKHLFLRARPDSGEGAYSFFNWHAWGSGGSAYLSFPSGDVSIVAGASLFFMVKFRRSPWAVLFGLTPLATAFARVYYGRHWASDTWMAFCLGLAFAVLLEGFSVRRWRALPGASSPLYQAR